MTPFPLALESLLGHWGSYIVYLLIGIAFGTVLEMAGFSISTKLAAQFYFKDMTVLKVMFTAIIVAMVLIFLASGLGLLDFNLVWVNPTYLWPGIVGGLIMGVGFILGGFCPGTSLVAAATLKIDGLLFALGAFFGIFLFGETVGLFEQFWYSSYMGRFTLPELFGTDTGVVVVGVIVMALAAFAFAEFMERAIGKRTEKAPRWRYGAAVALLIVAFLTLFVGQPTASAKWERMASTKEAELNNRAVQIHPGELLELMYNHRIKLFMLDVRSETDYNLFHIQDAQHVPMDTLLATINKLRLEPDNSVFVAISNDEKAATEAWKMMTAESLPNAYILEGGINNWLTIFGKAMSPPLPPRENAQDDELRYILPAALGARYPAATPNPDVFKLEYTSKVQLKSKRGGGGGGCG